MIVEATRKLSVVLAGLVVMAGCGENEESVSRQPTDASAAGRPATNYYETTGTLRLLRPEIGRLVIEHEEIPGYMPKMTMPFKVLDVALMEGLQPNDRLAFRIVDTPDEAWIDSIRKTGVAEPVTGPTNRMFRVVRDVEPLAVGDPVPAYTFTNQLGQPVRLGDLRGTAYGMTFIFTRCQYPEFCPRMSRNFAEAAKLLRADAASPTNWHLFSLSFDVEYDTPEVLAGYARHQRYDPAYWSFLTGALIDVDAITEQFGLVFPRSDTFGFDHNMRTVVVDARGKVHSILIGNEWKPEELAEDLKKAAAAN